MQLEDRFEKGSLKQLFYIALPMLISNACDTVMTFTDRIFLATLDGHLLNAAMLGGICQFSTIITFSATISYATALVAQFYGAKKFKLCSITFTQAIILSAISYPLILLIAKFIVHPLVFSSTIDSAQLEAQQTYFDILINFSFLILIRVSLISFFSGTGRTKFVMISSITAMVTNVIFNYILIFGKLGFEPMGIKGAALGTVIGSIAGNLVLLIPYLLPQNVQFYDLKNSLKIYTAGLKKLLKYGYPLGVGALLNYLAFNATVGIYHSVSPVAATAISITYSWDMLFFVPLLGLELAIVSLIGRYMGAKDMESINKTLRSIVKFSIIYSIVMIIVVLVTPTLLVDLFMPKDNIEIFNIARPSILIMIRLIAIYVVSEVIRVVITGILKGAGDTFIPMVIAMFVHWAMVIATYVGLVQFNLSLEMVWFIDSIVTIFSGFFTYLRFRTGNWRRIQILDHSFD